MESENERLLEEATGYAELGMWAEATAALEGLPPEVSESLPGRLLRLEICTGRGDWEAGDALMAVILTEHPESEGIEWPFRRFGAALARVLMEGGALEAADYLIACFRGKWPDFLVESGGDCDEPSSL